MNTGEKIRKFRLEKKIKQEEIADLLNISQRAYSKIENNEVQIKVDRLQQIAEILDVETKKLLPESNNNHFENVNYSQIGNGKVINNANNKIEELYKKIIKKQEEEIEYLKGIVDVFKK
ncbi:MAG: helix-turn-helix transcriptional regulator [Flavobacteriia bacterium]|nr:helix-turn-helix transcriptional regulator [Flavobacteriia bacterium]